MEPDRTACGRGNISNAIEAISLQMQEALEEVADERPPDAAGTLAAVKH